MRRISAAGLVIYVLTMTFAGVDWIMSREAHYFSTIVGFGLLSWARAPVLSAIGGTVAFGAFLSLVFAAIRRRRGRSS